jgi:GWxTD domain-containing protein
MNRTRFLSAALFFLLCPMLAGIIVYPVTLAAQAISVDNTRGFFFDVLAFKGTTDTAQRLDVFVVAPYQHLRFEKQNDRYVASYPATIILRDSTGKEREKTQRRRSLVEDSYEATVGATARFDYTQSVFNLPSGTYTVEVTMYDDLSKNERTRSRKVNVPPFSRFPFSMSSIMLASSIAQTGQGLTVTPHITDDVTMLLEDELFAFFESYSSSSAPDSALFVYEILDDHNKSAVTGSPVSQALKRPKDRHYLRVNLSGSLPTGTYTLRVLALRAGTKMPYSQSDILAVSEHSLRVDTKAGYGPAGDEELALAIRQLRYVASSAEMDQIEAGENIEERRRRFLDFWRTIDPTPNTARNEAYEEYYRRVDYANQTFRSYTEGWQTDMGMVYIIFGPPNNVERQSYRSDGRIVEVWYYPQNRQLVFVDYTGFGDFRLASPLGSSDRFRFN